MPEDNASQKRLSDIVRAAAVSAKWRFAKGRSFREGRVALPMRADFRIHSLSKGA